MNKKYDKIRGLLSYSLAALFLLYEMGVQSSPNVIALPLLHEFHFGAALLGIVMGVYFYSYALMQVPVGLLFDRYSSRWVLSLAVLICVTGNILFYFAQGPGLLALGRFVMGFGSAFAFVGVLVSARQHFPTRYFALLVGVAQLVAAFGAMAGEMPLAYLVRFHGWRGTTFFLIIFGAILMLLIGFCLRTKRGGAAKSSELSSKEALKRVFGNKRTYLIALYAFTAWTPITIFAELWGVPFLQVRFHLSAIYSAAINSLVWWSLAIVSPVLGAVSDYLAKRVSLMRMCSLVGILASLLLLLLSPSSGWLTLVGLILAMLGIGIAASGQILTFALINDHVEKGVMATAISVNNMAVVIGGAIFQPLVGLLLRLGQQSPNHYSGHDYVVALIVIPLCYVVGWLVAKFAL
jgi:MFS family permease